MRRHIIRLWKEGAEEKKLTVFSLLLLLLLFRLKDRGERGGGGRGGITVRWFCLILKMH